MANNSKDLKRRIVSVKSTQKITRAMKLVAASKFARAQTAVRQSKPYCRSLDQMVSQILHGEEQVQIDITTAREVKKVLVAVVSTDRGLCGGLNSHICKKLAEFGRKCQADNLDLSVLAWGKKGYQFAKHRFNVVENELGILTKPSYQDAVLLTQKLRDLFLNKTYDQVFLLYPEFESALVQLPKLVQLLPMVPQAIEENTNADSAAPYIIEPSARELLPSLLNKKIVSTVFQALLDGQASEQGSRMSAMDSATRNAGDVIQKLTLQYNRARQAAITNELIEIVSGAEAL